MKKTYKLLDVDCGNCAAKIEHGISKLDDVTDVKVNFMGQRMILEAPDDKFDAVFKQAKKIIKKIDSGVSIET
ncbi:cation transporter [Mammaliicoccus lentus]|uniref:Cation transporter n=2 Tax=Bacillales TaxID=1385 RepID=A0AAX3W3S2_MAMLE|nr:MULTISPECIES: cation transporter [Bacillales]MBO0994595.1 cation transporter [Bacillus sp. SD088]WHI60011.1 cation transporter [Mammaliicoccus lentus]GGP08721.1 heavy metal transporter [Oceanobacillus neutriphilus]